MFIKQYTISHVLLLAGQSPKWLKVIQGASYPPTWQAPSRKLMQHKNWKMHCTALIVCVKTHEKQLKFQFESDNYYVCVQGLPEL